MITRFFWSIIGLVVLLAAAPRPANAREEALMAFSKGQTFNDVGADGDKTTYHLADCPELGGKACKVIYADNDSVGVRVSSVKDWQPFIALQFNVFNPSKEPDKFIFSIVHKGTTGYPTRADIPLTAKPGKNAFKIGIDQIANTNGSKPDLSDVRKWYIACDGKGSTVFFGDIALVGDATPGTGNVGAAGGAGAAASARRAVNVSDPARLARIRAAKMPRITRPVQYCDPAADAICAALEVFPPDNPWNAVVADWPVHANSKNMVASVGANKPLRYNADMTFVIVPPNQPRVNVKITVYGGESDKGPFPVPDNLPIEGWPAYYQREGKKYSFDEVQRNVENTDADRHAVVVDPVNHKLYEFYQMKKTASGWEGTQASIFDLTTNQLRPDGWTSTDAAGLPIYPAIVRYDELKRGEIEHALRVTIVKTRRAYVSPATHFASPRTDKNLPRMGERFRLRADFDVSGFSPETKTILKALKKYGMFVADNGIEWAISVAPDPRIPDLSDELRKVKGSDFEVVTPVP